MSKLADWEGFLQRYTVFSKQASQKKYDDFLHRFNRFKANFDTVNAFVRELKKQTGSDFNVFFLLGVERKEVKTHSAVLSDLLNPEGSHCQGTLFLEKFLQHCERTFQVELQPVINKVADTSWVIEKEKHTLFGNLDIVISSPENNFLLVIENKIDAGEQENQLERYSQWLEGRNVEKKYLIYLTKSRYKSQTSGQYKYFRMSYHHDIYKWLEESNREVSSSRVKETICQYIDLIKNI